MSKAFIKGMLGAALVSVIAIAQPSVAGAQENFPTKPISLIVPYPAGGTLDVMTRLIGEGISKELGQTVLTENRTGGASVVASEYVARAPADGYTLLSASTTAMTVVPLVYKNLPFQVSDFQPIATTALTPYLIAVPAALPVKTIDEFIAYAKERPGELNYYQLGPGTMPHLFTEMLLANTGITATPVPYQGGAPALNALIANEIQLMANTPDPALVEQHKAGNVRIIGVADVERTPLLPDVPTFKESGYPEIVAPAWFGFLGPKGMPEEVVSKLERAIENALKDEHVRERLQTFGLMPHSSGAAELQKLMNEEFEKWGAVVEKVGVSLEQ